MAIEICKNCGHKVSTRAQRCPKCSSTANFPDSVWSAKSQALKKSVRIYEWRAAYKNPQAILGILALIWLFGGCVHRVGYPWNCAEAKAAVREAQNDYDANYSRQMSKKYADEEMINTTYLKQFALSKAENKLNELCPN